MAQRGDGMLYRRGRIWWLKFCQNGDTVRMSADTADEKIARKLPRDQTARVQLNEPLVVGSIRVTYTELRDDLVAHYQATGVRDVEEAGWRIAHLDRAFRGLRASQVTSGRGRCAWTWEARRTTTGAWSTSPPSSRPS